MAARTSTGRRPPDGLEVGRRHLGVDADRLGEEVEAEPGDADDRGEPESAEQVAARLPAVETDEVAGPHVDRRPVHVVEQVERERHRDERKGDAGELVGEVEPGPSRRRRLVHRRRLLRQRDRPGQLLDDAEHGVDGGRRRG